MLKTYKQVKEHYFKNNKETMLINLMDQQDYLDNITSENRHLKKQLEKAQQEISLFKTSFDDSYINRIRDLEKDLSQLKQQAL
jgi:hypothetical protein